MIFQVNIITGSGIMAVFFLKGIAEKSGNRKYNRLSFVQYLQTMAS